jgi:hypothetical protein
MPERAKIRDDIEDLTARINDLTREYTLAYEELQQRRERLRQELMDIIRDEIAERKATSVPYRAVVLPFVQREKR